MKYIYHGQDTLKTAKINQIYYLVSLICIQFIYVSPLKSAGNLVFGCFGMVDRHRRERPEP